MYRIFFIPDGQDAEAGWPEFPPRDLELRLMDLMSYQTWSHHDLWDELRAWLESHSVPVPKSVLENDPSK